MSIFPFINPEAFVDNSSSGELPLYCEYAFDFKQNCLKTKNGQNYFVYENEALLVWIYKALITEHYRYTAYSPAFGSEIHTLYGMNVDMGVLQSELKRYVTEALMVCPYIRELSDFAFINENDILGLQFRCTTIYGSFDIALKGDGQTWTLAFTV